jgi:hypothetical protein
MLIAVFIVTTKKIEFIEKETRRELQLNQLKTKEDSNTGNEGQNSCSTAAVQFSKVAEISLPLYE